MKNGKEIISKLEDLNNSQKLMRLNDRFSPKNQIQRLHEEKVVENFNNRVQKVKELRKKVKKETNIFRIIKSRSTEDKISDFYSWLLNSNESHSFDEFFLKRFLEKAFEKDDEKSYSNYSFRLTEAEIESRPSKEEGDPDFVISIPDKNENEFGLVMESKFGAEEGENQLKRYREFASNNFDVRLLVFLTTGSREPTSEEEGKKSEWVQISHKELLHLLDHTSQELFRKHDNIEGETKKLIKRFKDYLEWGLMDREIRNKCRGLWNDYKAGLEKIVEFRLREGFGEVLKEAIEGEDWYSPDDWEFNVRKRATLFKNNWNQAPTRIFFKINPIDPAEGTVAVKLHHKTPSSQERALMSEDERAQIKEKVVENRPESFEVPDSSVTYIRTFCYEEFKPENYLSIVEWTIERLRQLNNEYSEIIDEAIDKSMNE